MSLADEQRSYHSFFVGALQHCNLACMSYSDNLISKKLKLTVRLCRQPLLAALWSQLKTGNLLYARSYINYSYYLQSGTLAKLMPLQIQA